MVAEAWRATPRGKLRARGLGLPFEGQPGLHDAITDVGSVEVGYPPLTGIDGRTAVELPHGQLVGVLIEAGLKLS